MLILCVGNLKKKCKRFNLKTIFKKKISKNIGPNKTVCAVVFDIRYISAKTIDTYLKT